MFSEKNRILFRRLDQTDPKVAALAHSEYQIKGDFMLQSEGCASSIMRHEINRFVRNALIYEHTVPLCDGVLTCGHLLHTLYFTDLIPSSALAM